MLSAIPQGRLPTSGWGVWNSCCHALPQHGGHRLTANVTSRVRPSCVGCLAPRWGLGRGGVCARAQEGSGEAELAPEPKRGRTRRNLRPSPGNLRGLSYPLFAIFIS